jgi:hypothetical protein
MELSSGVEVLTWNGGNQFVNAENRYGGQAKDN